MIVWLSRSSRMWEDMDLQRQSTETWNGPCCDMRDISWVPDMGLVLGVASHPFPEAFSYDERRSTG